MTIFRKALDVLDELSENHDVYGLDRNRFENLAQAVLFYVKGGFSVDGVIRQVSDEGLLETAKATDRTILFKNGKLVRREILLYNGAAMIGDPTAYFLRDGDAVWVKPGQSVDFVEA